MTPTLTIAIAVFLIGLMSIYLAYRILRRANEVAEEAMLQYDETMHLRDRLVEEYGDHKANNTDPVEELLEDMPTEHIEILMATLEDVKLQNPMIYPDLSEVLMQMAAMTDHYGAKNMARTIHVYTEYAHNLRMVGIVPDKGGE
jgi:hypothetical protein